MGYTISGRNFIITRAGLLRLGEVVGPAQMLGICDGVLQWRRIDFSKAPSFESKTVRLTSNASELYLHPECKIPTMRGIVKASQIRTGDYLEILNTDENSAALRREFKGSGSNSRLDTCLSYLAGAVRRQLQNVSSHELEINYVGYPDDAKAYGDALLELCHKSTSHKGQAAKVSISEEGRYKQKIVLQCRGLGQVLHTLLEHEPVPRQIREHIDTLEAYVKGWLDMRSFPRWRRIMFRTEAIESETRRIVFNALILGGVSPMHTSFTHKDGVDYVYTHLGYGAVRKLQLKNPRLLRPVLGSDECSDDDDPRRGFTKISHISKFAHEACLSLPNVDPEWKPLVEMTPLQRHEYVF